MSKSRKRKTAETKLVEAQLKPEFPSVEAYRYNLASIRVRIVDDRFRGKSLSQRDEMVTPLLADLPQEVQDDITLLLLFAPDEPDRSPISYEFDHPGTVVR